MSTFFRNVPSLNEILESPPLKQLIETANRQSVVVGAKKFLMGVEAEVRSATASVPVPSVRDLAAQIARWISEGQPPRALPIINATGDVLHPELSVPPLAKEAIAAMQVASSGYLSQPPGRQGDSFSAETLLCELTSADAALLTHSGASALLAALAAVKNRGEILVSRGDLVQSPRGVRISDIAHAAGVTLREIGAANRTTLADYENALHAKVGAILSVRWTEVGGHIPLSDLTQLAKRKGVALVADLGGASLLDLSEFGLSAPTFGEAVKAMPDLITGSLDELVGGPSAGAVIGKKTLIEAIRAEPIGSLVTANAATVAGLAATLELYREPKKALESIPALSLISTGIANLEFRAHRIASQIAGSSILESVEVERGTAPFAGQLGSSHVIPTYCIKILPKISRRSTLEAQLAAGHPGLIVRSLKDFIYIDLRSVFPDQDAKIAETIEGLAGETP
jgi:L-seryl-tRNA(Ser) seleniumtransferase